MNASRDTAEELPQGDSPSLQAAPATGDNAAASPSRARSVVAALLIVGGVLLSPAAIVGSWLSWEIRDTTGFVEAFGPLAEDPAIQALIVTAVVDEVDRSLGVDELVAEAFGSLESLGLPPRAATAMGLLQGPVSQGVRSMVTVATERVVASDMFASLWTQGLYTAHSQLVRTLEGSSSAVAIADDGSLGIQLGPIVAAVKAQLLSSGFSLASVIPEISTVLVVAQSDQLAQVVLWYPLVAWVGQWLPWVALALFGAGIAVAVNRRRTILVAGVSVAAAMAVLVVPIGAARALVRGAAASTQLTPEAAAAIYDAATGFIHSMAWGIAVLGVLAACGALLCGRSPLALRVRGACVALVNTLRAWLGDRGFSTGAVGQWLHGNRVLLRSFLVAGVVLLMLLARPVTPGIVGWGAAACLLVLLVLEVLQRPATRSTGG